MMNPSNSPSIDRKQSFLLRSLSTSSLIPNCGGGGGEGGGSTVAEFCGCAAASCAALWCCGPCSVVNLVVLAVYKVPRGIVRRAIRRVRQRRLTKKKGIREESGECEKKLSKSGSSQFAVHPLENKEEVEDFDESNEVRDLTEEEEEDEAVMALEKEMWNRFYSGGFWRSLSQAETNSSPREPVRDF